MGDSRSISFIIPDGVAFFNGSDSVACGGAERQLFLLSQGLRDAGWRVRYIVNRAKVQFGCKIGDEVLSADLTYLGGSKSKFIPCMISLCYALFKASSDAYIVKVPTHLLFPVGILCCIMRKKLFFWAQMRYDAYPHERPRGSVIANWMYECGLRLCSKVFAQTEEQVSGFREFYSIDAVFLPSIAASLKESIRTNSKDVDVLWVGHTGTHKRIELAIAVAQRLPQCTFAFLLNNFNDERYQDVCVQCRGLSNVVFVGQVHPVDVEGWFDRAKLLLNTSLCEGFPNTFLQAWQRGMPVISSGIDPDDVVARHALGFVAGEVTAPDLVELCGEIEAYCNNKKVCESVKMNSVQYVRSHSIENAVSLFVNEMEECE